ncbi:hypothetical protein R4282_16160 [Rhodococcus oxybenzonivorans]|uniref:hypothetical protein n=1 Tax=Rhodococcus TaxID=1827 RepID=UPI00131F56FB|nr:MULTISPECIES: hypothetical protein [Rhodococcus]MDV7354535.1 hypothetical protein [Rhodococcus oxybenzonivorans]QHE71013.1 hypothetical protein GFS60_04610 [Rhodococcus sp. WAY2]
MRQAISARTLLVLEVAVIDRVSGLQPGASDGADFGSKSFVTGMSGQHASGRR